MQIEKPTDDDINDMVGRLNVDYDQASRIVWGKWRREQVAAIKEGLAPFGSMAPPERLTTALMALLDVVESV